MSGVGTDPAGVSLGDPDLLRAEASFAATDRPDVLILACGAIAREVLAVIRLNGWTHVDVRCLPAKLHNTPAQIADAVDVKLAESPAATTGSSSPMPIAAPRARWTSCWIDMAWNACPEPTATAFWPETTPGTRCRRTSPPPST